MASRAPGSTAPFTMFVLVLPCGISSGFVSVTLPFVLTRAGFPVAVSASVIALGLSANIWRFLWGPIADLTLTLRRWYGIALTACAVTLLALGFMPLRQNLLGLLTIVVFVSQVAATLVVLPVGGMMAHTVATEQKGRAAGWYQAGNLGGNGLGGGAGVWLASHFSNQVAGGVLAVAMLACAGALYFVPDASFAAGEHLGERIRHIGRDFRDMARSPLVLFTIVLFGLPLGAGAASNLWPAVAPDWRATADTVALVTGLLSGVASAVGCVLGGWCADRVGRWWSFFGSSAAIAVVAIVMAAAPRTSMAFSAGVLWYALATGWSFAAFSAVLLHVIGRGAASTKYALMASLANIPVVYMTAFDGWAHDRYGAGGMLNAEALLSLLALAIGLAVLGPINAASRDRISA